MQTKNSKFLAKGTYGCVFYPSINACSGKIEDDIDSDHYITKIQSYLPNEQDEILIGQTIQTLPLYDHYFAPVVKSCKINTVNMDYNLVKTCATMQNELGELNTTSAYVSNKIRYVGKHHIAKYLQNLTKTPQKLYRKLVNTHLHILDALQILASEQIVHFDIKPQNIMYDDIQDIPIIIDFGLSRVITPLLSPEFNPSKNAKLMQHTFVSYDTYDYWCIDIYILSNIGSKTFLKPDAQVSEGQIKALLRGFITPNFLAILSGDEVYQFKQSIIHYFLPFIEQKQTWLDVFRVLIQNYAKWDNYSTALTYLYSYIKAKATTVKYSGRGTEGVIGKYREQISSEFQQYLSILKNIVIAMPDERPLPEETQQTIQELFASKQELDQSSVQKQAESEPLLDDDDDIFSE
jgi:serine/threonine protein kinase